MGRGIPPRGEGPGEDGCTRSSSVGPGRHPDDFAGTRGASRGPGGTPRHSQRTQCSCPALGFAWEFSLGDLREKSLGSQPREVLSCGPDADDDGGGDDDDDDDDDEDDGDDDDDARDDDADIVYDFDNGAADDGAGGCG